jgi:hypothetical protein
VGLFLKVFGIVKYLLTILKSFDSGVHIVVELMIVELKEKNQEACLASRRFQNLSLGEA